MNIVITSGGTRVPLDEVRYIGNMSSGRFATELGLAALKLRHKVSFLYAKGTAAPHLFQVNLCKEHDEYLAQLAQLTDLVTLFQPGPTRDYEAAFYNTFEEYRKRLGEVIELRRPDMVILAAAVSDFGVQQREGKIDSASAEGMVIKLQKLPKIISMVKKWCPETFLVGFKLLVGASEKEQQIAAHEQMLHARSDVVVVNDLRELRNGNHTLTLYGKGRDRPFATLAGTQLAERLFVILEAINKSKEIK